MVDMNDGAGLKFSTSLETEYPGPLCRQLALAFLERMQSQGKQLTPAAGHSEQLHKLGAGTQPRGGRSPILMGEFQFKIEVTSFEEQPPQCIEDDTVCGHFRAFPLAPNSFLLEIFLKWGRRARRKKVSELCMGYFSTNNLLEKGLGIGTPS